LIKGAVIENKEGKSPLNPYSKYDAIYRDPLREKASRSFLQLEPAKTLCHMTYKVRHITQFFNGYTRAIVSGI
jgi:hypothetical protein